MVNGVHSNGFEDGWVSDDIDPLDGHGQTDFPFEEVLEHLDGPDESELTGSHHQTAAHALRVMCQGLLVVD